MGIKFLDADGIRRLKLIVEVGFAKSYPDLVDDAKLWLEGWRSVCTVILASIVESPLFKNPLSDLTKNERNRLDLLRRERGFSYLR